MTWCVIIWAFVASPASNQDVIAIQQDDLAPFDGLLVPEERFIELLEAERISKDLEIRLTMAEQTNTAIEQIYRGKLQDAVVVPWYESPSFNRWVGILIGGAVAGLTVWAVVELQAAQR